MLFLYSKNNDCSRMLIYDVIMIPENFLKNLLQLMRFSLYLNQILYKKNVCFYIEVMIL